MKLVTVTIIAAACALSASPADAATLVGRATVIDGDSISIGGQDIDILDVDAPEGAQFCFKKGENLEAGAWPCGRAAAQALSSWIGDRDVTCDTTTKEANNVWLARCSVAGEDIAAWLAGNGWAVPARDCKCEVVRSAADHAEAEQLGIWSSAFTLPWDWRKAH